MQIKQIGEMINTINQACWEVTTSTWAMGQFEAARDLINSLEAAEGALLDLRDTREDHDALLAEREALREVLHELGPADRYSAGPWDGDDGA